MNDDFLKKHRARPDAEFVENLYQKLEGSDARRITTCWNQIHLNLRQKLGYAFAFIGIALLLLGFSPTVRVMVLDWWQVTHEHVETPTDKTEHLTPANQIDTVDFVFGENILNEPPPDSDHELKIDFED